MFSEHLFIRSPLDDYFCICSLLAETLAIDLTTWKQDVMFDIFLSSIYHYQEHASFTYSNSSCYQYFSLLILTKVCLFNFRYLSFFLAKSYYSVAAILNVPEISQNKRLLAKTKVDKIFEKYLTQSSFIIKLQTLTLSNH